ncbi:MAG TPA: RNA methyltransferase [Verrucomicrobiae bacterium]|jgi:tRNA G18 (ribose-2'-O)-methylase SpoU
MLHIEHVSSLDAPELAPYRTMRQQREQWQQGNFVAEGEKVVRRLLESRFTVVSVLMPEHWLKHLEPQLLARPENIRVFVADKKLLETLTGFSLYQGLLAVGKIPAMPSLSDLLAASAKPRLFVAVDALTNAENLGALVRNCVAFGAQGLLVGETSNSPYLRRAVRSSMGTIFQLPVVELASLAQTLREFRGHGIRCVAAHPHIESRTVTQSDLALDCCLVFGSEGYGISPAVLDECDEVVAIPMHPGVDSLNVGSAGAVFLYEASRQRGRM